MKKVLGCERLKFHVLNCSTHLGFEEQRQKAVDRLNKGFIHPHLKSLKQLDKTCQD